MLFGVGRAALVQGWLVRITFYSLLKQLGAELFVNMDR